MHSKPPLKSSTQCWLHCGCLPGRFLAHPTQAVRQAFQVRVLWLAVEPASLLIVQSPPVYLQMCQLLQELQKTLSALNSWEHGFTLWPQTLQHGCVIIVIITTDFIGVRALQHNQCNTRRHSISDEVRSTACFMLAVDPRCTWATYPWISQSLWVPWLPVSSPQLP